MVNGGSPGASRGVKVRIARAWGRGAWGCVRKGAERGGCMTKKTPASPRGGVRTLNAAAVAVGLAVRYCLPRMRRMKPRKVSLVNRNRTTHSNPFQTFFIMCGDWFGAKGTAASRSGAG